MNSSINTPRSSSKILISTINSSFTFSPRRESNSQRDSLKQAVIRTRKRSLRSLFTSKNIKVRGSCRLSKLTLKNTPTIQKNSTVTLKKSKRSNLAAITTKLSTRMEMYTKARWKKASRTAGASTTTTREKNTQAASSMTR